MKLSTFKKHLQEVTAVTFLKPDGSQVPKHFHITEVGQISKHFIDCGGTVRKENSISMQLWESVDFWHRLAPEKLLNIIELSENKLDIGDHDIEIEYQGETIGKYHVGFENGQFQLLKTDTACLAMDKCGLPLEKVKVNLADLGQKVESCCSPKAGCC